MDDDLARALAAAARAFADSLDPGKNPNTNGAPQPGSAESMRHILGEVAAINDSQKRGVTEAEMAAIARAAGIDPRGTAGYYTRLSPPVKRWPLAHQSGSSGTRSPS